MYDIEKYLPQFVANGRPSEDTMRHYTTEINNYLKWLSDNAYDAQSVTEDDAKDYVTYLINMGYSDASIKLKVTVLKMFYFAAIKLKVTTKNPFENIKPKPPVYDDSDFDYLTVEELKRIVHALNDFNDSANVSNRRDIAIIMLMAVEGLRTVEIHRMNDCDIDFTKSRILIHGKNREEYIYPCYDTLKALIKYLDVKAEILDRPSKGKLPTFISLSKKYFGNRITRNGIRWSINKALSLIDRKTDGNSCHMLRHSCGTNLYAATKDLRLVQETLRQKSPEMAARYAHVNERMNDRKTGLISPFSKEENNNDRQD